MIISIYTINLCGLRVESNVKCHRIFARPHNCTCSSGESCRGRHGLDLPGQLRAPPPLLTLLCYRNAAARWEIISGSWRIGKYLQPSERFVLVLPFRRRWQFNWAVMATLVPGTSLQPCDSHSFIGNTRGPWGKDRDGKKRVLWLPLPCNGASSRPSCQVHPHPGPGWNSFSSVGGWTAGQRKVPVNECLHSWCHRSSPRFAQQFLFARRQCRDPFSSQRTTVVWNHGGSI